MDLAGLCMEHLCSFTPTLPPNPVPQTSHLGPSSEGQVPLCQPVTSEGQRQGSHMRIEAGLG